MNTIEDKIGAFVIYLYYKFIKKKKKRYRDILIDDMTLSIFIGWLVIILFIILLLLLDIIKISYPK